MSYNKVLARDYLKEGHRVFTTDSPDNALLIVRKTSKKDKLKRKDRITVARLEANTYSLPFKQPHCLLDVKIKVKDELYF